MTATVAAGVALWSAGGVIWTAVAVWLLVERRRGR